MFNIRAYTCVYACDTSCTYHIRSVPYVVRILHVFASIIENIRAHTADRMLIYTYAYTCIYVLSGSLMIHNITKNQVTVVVVFFHKKT